MRIALAALCVLALTGSANADYILKGQFRAPCKMTPPAYALHEPSVPYTIGTWPQAKVERLCKGNIEVFQPITACAMRPGWIGNKEWVIAVSDFLSPKDLACALVYEKAHMPPNNWQDKAWEEHVTMGTPYITRQSAPLSH